jgi:hypothetical protein
LTFILSIIPELAGMEDLGILFQRDSGIRLLIFVLSTMPELAGMEELEIFI